VHLEDILWLLAGSLAINDVLQKDLFGAALSPRRQWFGWIVIVFFHWHGVVGDKASSTAGVCFQLPKDDDVIM
jgi:hypothetical protein